MPVDLRDLKGWMLKKHLQLSPKQQTIALKPPLVKLRKKKSSSKLLNTNVIIKKSSLQEEPKS